MFCCCVVHTKNTKALLLNASIDLNSNANSFPNVLVVIAEGSEDIESVTIIDVLRRTKSVNLLVATVNGAQICASQKTKIIGDCTIESVANHIFDMICIPGGIPGAVKYL